MDGSATVEQLNAQKELVRKLKQAAKENKNVSKEEVGDTNI